MKHFVKELPNCNAEKIYKAIFNKVTLEIKTESHCIMLGNILFRRELCSILLKNSSSKLMQILVPHELRKQNIRKTKFYRIW